MKRLCLLTLLAFRVHSLVQANDYFSWYNEREYNRPCVDTYEMCDEPCDKKINWCRGWAFSADYLYWKASHSSLDYVFETDPDSPASDIAGKLIELCPEFESGYRLSLFKEFSCWDFGAQYTSYDATTRDSVSRSAEIFIPTRGTTAELEGMTDNANATYAADYDVVDILLGYRHCFSCLPISVRPFAGARLAWIDQKIETHYLVSSAEATVMQNVNMDGYGLTLGLDSSLYLFRPCFSLFGRTALSLLHASFSRDWITFDNMGGLAAHATATTVINVLPVFELAAGLKFPLPWCFYGQIGYEFHAWRTPDFLFLFAEMNSAPTAVPTRERTFLGFQGLTVRATLRF